MRIKLDENLPTELVEILVALGHEVDTVSGEGLIGANDDTVWHATQATSRFLITQDLDFSDIRRYRPGAHGGILLVRLRHPTRRRLLDRVSRLFAAHDVGGWAHRLVIATDNKVRIRRPSTTRPGES